MKPVKPLRGFARTNRLRVQQLEDRTVPTTFVVMNTNNAGAGSLRQAILDANTSSGPDTIDFDAGVFATPRTITLASNLFLSDAVAINGPGPNLLTINGGRAIDSTVPSDMPMSLSGFTLADTGFWGLHTEGGIWTVTDCVFTRGWNGGGELAGRGIRSGNGSLTLIRCVVSSNTGGGIYCVNEKLTIIDSTITDNTLTYINLWGAGLFMRDGSLTVINSTISSNEVTDPTTGYGGGMYIFGTIAGITITNSTICNNLAGREGGGIFFGDGDYSLASVLIQNSTITLNRAFHNGGIQNVAGPPMIALQSTIIAGNTAYNSTNSPDGSGPFQGNNNLIGVINGMDLLGNGNLSGTEWSPLDPRLGPPTDNHGPTQTCALLSDSPAINAGGNPTGLTTDQRGNGYLRVAGSAADIGAFEVQGPPKVSLTRVNGGSAQRSRVTGLTVTFSTEVSFLNGDVAGSFSLIRNGGKTVSFTAAASVVNGVTVVELKDFFGAETQFGSLRDGRYTLTALASQISANLLPLDGNGDGTGGDNYTFGDAEGLYRFFGDINGDRRVDIADFGLLSLSYLNQANYVAAFDFNGDGRIDILDFGQFSIRYLASLP